MATMSLERSVGCAVILITMCRCVHTVLLVCGCWIPCRDVLARSCLFVASGFLVIMMILTILKLWSLLIQGIEEVRKLIAGEQGSKAWLVFLLPTAEAGDLLLDVKFFDRWRAIELSRTRPFTATNNLPYEMNEASEQPQDQTQEWPESSATLSKALSGRPAELEVLHVDTHPDADGDGFVDPEEFAAYLAANRTVRLGAEFVRVSGVMLHYKGETKPYKGINGDYQRSQEVSNGRAVYIKVNKPSTAMWWTNNDGKLSWGKIPRAHVLGKSYPVHFACGYARLWTSRLADARVLPYIFACCINLPGRCRAKGQGGDG